MANTYESKFKGVEVDEGVNIARNLTGTGGIEVKKTATGTINATVTIDGSGKQDTITNQTSLNVGALNVNGTITGKDLSMTGNVNIEGVQVSITGETITFDSAHDDITFKSRYNAPVVFDVAAQFKGPSGAMFYLGDTGEYVKLMPAMNGTGIYDVRLPDTGGTLALTSDITTALTGKQDKLTTGSEISIKKLQATTIGAQDNGSLTIVDPLTVSNDVYVNELAATKGTFWSGAIVQGTLTGETAHFATGVTVDGYSSFNGIYVDNSTSNPICFKRNGGIVTKMYGPTSGGGELVNVYLPGKGGTLALTSDIPTGGGGTTIATAFEIPTTWTKSTDLGQTWTATKSYQFSSFISPNGNALLDRKSTLLINNTSDVSITYAASSGTRTLSFWDSAAQAYPENLVLEHVSVDDATNDQTSYWGVLPMFWDTNSESARTATLALLQMTISNWTSSTSTSVIATFNLTPMLLPQI